MDELGGHTPTVDRRVDPERRTRRAVGRGNPLFVTPMKWICAAFWLSITCPFSSAAPEISEARGWLHLNGYTHHFDAPGANDNLFGLGLTWYVQRFGSPAVAWEGDVFEDSGRK